MMSRWGVGQNLLRDRGETFLPPDWTFTVTSWFSEIRSVALASRQDAVYRREADTGHFVQMVWADTHNIGCGMIIYERYLEKNIMSKLFRHNKV